MNTQPAIYLDISPPTRAKYYDKTLYESVLHIGKLEVDKLDEVNPDEMSKYCEYLIKSKSADVVLSRLVMYEYFSRANLKYVNPKTGDNLLHTAVLSGNFVPIDILLELKCSANVRNKMGNTAEMIAYNGRVHKTILAIFEKYRKIDTPKNEGTVDTQGDI